MVPLLNYLLNTVMMRQLCYLWSLLLLSCNLYAQKTGKDSTLIRKPKTQVYGLNQSGAFTSLFPTTIPASPNAASLGKFGETPVSLYSGVPSVSVPIYQINANHLKLPISIDYHAGGIKVEEVAGFVGLGFALNAGGVVSRTVIDRPDDEFNRGILNNSLTEDYFSNIDQSTLFVRNDNIISNKLDKQPDVFYFNFGGNAGKFSLRKGHLTEIKTLENKNLTIQLLNYQNNQSIQGFVITDNGGTQYFFEDPEIQNVDETLNNTLTDESYHYTSSWYLSKIVSPMGDVITLNYISHTLKYFTKSSEYQEYRILDNNLPPPNDCVDGSYASSGIQTTKNEVNLQALKLSSIVFDKGIVKFYSSVRQDLQQELKLDSIEVCSPSQCGVKKFRFAYSYFDESLGGQSTYDNMTSLYANCAYKRLRLEAITEVGDANTSSPKHSFEYYSGTLPNRFSNAQDHWGYYNGATNPTLLPSSFYVNPQSNAINIGNASRESSLANTLIGTLKSITYPTGGKSQFDYELHEACHDNFYNSQGLGGYKIYFQDFQTQNVSIFNFSSTEYLATHQATTDIILTQTITVGANGMAISVNSSLNNTTNPETFGAVVLVTGDNNVSRTYQLRNIGLNNLYLLAGTYTFELRFTNIDEYFQDVSVNVTGAERTQPTANRINIGGLRVKKIESFSFTAGVPNTKKLFDYTLTASGSTCQSSGVLVSEPDYVSLTKKGFSCSSSDQTIPPENYYNYLTLTARSNAPLSLTKGNALGYGQVTVYDDSLGNEGKVVHFFTTANDYPDGVDYVYNAPVSDRDWARGLEINVKTFQKENGGYVIKKENANAYQYHQTAQTKAYMLGCDEQGRRSTAIRATNAAILEFGCTMIYPKQYDITSGWLSLDSTTQTVYETSGTHMSRLHYTYQNDFILPAKTRQFNSEGKVFDHHFKYPKDLGSPSVYSEMVDRNIINPVIVDSAVVAISEADAKNNVFSALSWQKTHYKKWFPTTTISGSLLGFYAPLYLENQQFQESKYVTLVMGDNISNPTSSTVVGYNSNGNPLYYQERNGIKTSLSWYGANDVGKQHLLKTIVKGYGSAVAQTTTYDYKPLVGISSQTDSRGLTTTFEYDALNRLQTIKDSEGKIVKNYTYHYANQATSEEGTCTTPAPVITSTPATTGCNSVLTASGCSNGTIHWSNGQTGTSITVPSVSSPTYTATCTTTCTSPASNALAGLTYPNGWTADNIGANVNGCIVLGTNTVKMQANSSGGIGSPSNDFHYFYHKQFSGNVTMMAKMSNLTNVAGIRAGIIFKNGLGLQDVFFSIIQDGDPNSHVVGKLHRSTANTSFNIWQYQNGLPTTLWFKVKKVGNSIQSYYSTAANPSISNDNDWTEFLSNTFGVPPSMSWGNNFLVGLTLENPTSTSPAEVMFSNIQIDDNGSISNL